MTKLQEAHQPLVPILELQEATKEVQVRAAIRTTRSFQVLDSRVFSCSAGQRGITSLDSR